MSVEINFSEKKSTNITYVDMHFDIDSNDIPKGDNGLLREKNNNDIRVDYDEYAIKNSLRNLFLTRKGQRLFLPDYGVNFYQYLFDPVNKFNAFLIARDIKQNIKIYEPRVDLDKIDIGINEEEQEYDVTLIVRIPKLNDKLVNFRGIISQTGFTV